MLLWIYVAEGVQLIKHTLKLAVMVFFVVASFVEIARAQTPDQDMILSKDDAAMLFKMSRHDWNSNVERAVKSGVAKATGGKQSGYVMHTFTPNWILSVGPNYSNPERPDFVQVIVGYREPIASKMTSKSLNNTIEKAKSELSPDFKVTGDIERMKGGVMIFFTILESKSQ